MLHGNKAISQSHRPKCHGTFKLWFNQAGRKQSRRHARQEKAARVFPRPIDTLRPAVQCPTLKYNTKTRKGRGFTVAELKGAGLTVYTARQIGIAVDTRRHDRSEERKNANIERLKSYLQRVVVVKGSTANVQQTLHAPAVARQAPKVETVAITDSMRQFQARDALQAFSDARHKKKENTDAAE